MILSETCSNEMILDTYIFEVPEHDKSRAETYSIIFHSHTLYNGDFRAKQESGVGFTKAVVSLCL